MYDPTRQYRCTIIRGKSKKEMDDLLPAYAKIINEICPCSLDDFKRLFNKKLSTFLPPSARTEKTLNNHRTEISGKLFGMYFVSDDDFVYESERTKKFLEDSDQPAFFKDICFKMQFPNGSQKINTILERISNHICIRPNAFILRFLQIAATLGIDITKRDIGYYILNSLDVLQGAATPEEVSHAIQADKHNGITRIIESDNRADSYNYQHINEQLNYLELANLIRIHEHKVFLNPKEHDTINKFAQAWNAPLLFDVYNFSLDDTASRQEFYRQWDEYYSKLSSEAESFTTSIEALTYKIQVAQQPSSVPARINLVQFGDEGEAVVFNYEKNRVSQYNQRLANKVLALGKTKGLGYDIQSVIAEPGDFEEFVKYIEVKSTKRLTVPDASDNLWIDSLNITRNEWIAAHQHKDLYSIYRVYFTQEGISIFVLNNVFEKIQTNKLTCTPMTYRVDFNNGCVDNILQV